MAASDQPAPDLTPPNDPAPLGADQGPGASPEDDARDMSPVIADGGDGPGRQETAHPQGAQGSAFDQQRRQGASGSDDRAGAVGAGQGMGRTAAGDEDRGYDQSGYRGGLGASGGREDLSDRNFDTDHNPFAGGYDGGGSHQPDAARNPGIGLDAANQAEEGRAADDQLAGTKPAAE